MLPSSIARPTLVTKQLKMNQVGDLRRVRVSSNFLKLVGFEPGMNIKVIPANEPLTGFSVVPSVEGDGTHIVYERSYKKKSGRSNNPLEAVIEFSSKQLIQNCFPSYTENFHVEMRQGVVKIRPIKNRVFSIIKKFKSQSPLYSMFVCTGGVDAYLAKTVGFIPEICLEHRPEEARDRASGRNLSEVHALNCLVNLNTIKYLFNEDIHNFDLKYFEEILRESNPIGLYHATLVCDDYSNAKSLNAKENSLMDLSTSVDMVYPTLKQIEVLNPACALLENVTGFQTSGARQVMVTSLRRMGYFVSEAILNGLDFGAAQARERYYMVASVFPGYSFPTPVPRSLNSIWHLVEPYLNECKDVTSTKMIRERDSYPRNMPPYLTKDSQFCHTVLKSQDRIRDGIFIKHDGRVLKPSINLLKQLMSIPSAFNVEWMAKEQATETLGQSIDYKLHEAVVDSIKKHLEFNCGPQKTLRYSNLSPQELGDRTFLSARK